MRYNEIMFIWFLCWNIGITHNGGKNGVKQRSQGLGPIQWNTVTAKLRHRGTTKHWPLNNKPFFCLFTKSEIFLFLLGHHCLTYSGMVCNLTSILVFSSNFINWFSNIFNFLITIFTCTSTSDSHKSMLYFISARLIFKRFTRFICYSYIIRH